MQKPFTQLGQRHNIIRQFTPTGSLSVWEQVLWR
jgi:hypothetical protein